MPFAIPAVAEGAALGGEAIEAGTEAYEAYRLARAARAAANLARAAKALQATREGAQADACSTCPPPDKDPCAHLRSNKGGPGDYRGGAHGETIKPANDGLDSHHMPSADAVKQTLEGDLPRNDVPAIQMEPGDHRETLSWGSSSDAAAYRQSQQDLINKGKFMDAFENDAANARQIAADAGDPTRYDQAIKEARAYAECLEKNGLTQKQGGK